jgi:ribosome-binding ATPase YchF (GTP1/OBG family)
MDVGIVGAPGSGRTTMFDALLAHRAPGDSGERHSRANIGVIQVQDPRLDRLAERFKPRKVTPIEIRVHDLCTSLEPTFPRSELEGMKRMDVLLLVLPAFAGEPGEASARELDRLVGELGLEDLDFVEKRLRFASRDKLPEVEVTALERARETLEAEAPVGSAELSDAQRDALRGFALLTDRAFTAVLNVAEDAAGAPPPPELAKRATELGMPLLCLASGLEAEMAELPPDERMAFLSEFGAEEPAGALVTRVLLEQMNVIPFFTVGEDECRAWPIERGTSARRAAGRVHSDIERGFIRAEVIAWDELDALPGGLVEAKKRGVLRVEGKDYVVGDGEVVHFRFNV